MSPQLQLATITADFLASPESGRVLPEFESLKQSIENNGGHDHQTTFDHTVSVMRGMETLFQAEFLTPADTEVLANHLAQKIETHTRKDLLRLLVLVHDLAKPETTVTNPDGTTGCPGHELLSVARVQEFQDRFELGQSEVTWVQQLVRLHGEPHQLLTLGLAKPAEQVKIMNTFIAVVGDGALELILMVHADLLGGDLATLNPQEFEARTALCRIWLTHVLKTVT
jgi:hypothetical protein